MELNGTITENRVDLGGTITAKKTLAGALAPTGGSAGPVVVTRGTGTNSLIEVHTTSPNIASEASSVAIGGGNQSTAAGAVAIGTNNVASAQNAVAIGSKLAGADPNTASAPAATALGLSCLASGYGSVATGYNATASGTGATSMGYQTSATNDGATASGYGTVASGQGAVALGLQATASGTGAAAVGRDATASGAASTALGRGTTASASQALAAGRDTKAEAVAATALGYGTDATGARSLVAGAYNEPDANAVDTTHGSGARKYLMIVGNGTADTARSNAATLDWDGNAVFAGKATVGAAPTADMDVATKKYVDDNAGGGPSPATTAPAMDGTAAVGTSTAYARADHVHPTDTSRAAASELAAKADKVTEVTVSADGAVTQALDAGKIYHFTGAVTALTITLNAPASGQLAQYHFDFLSGSTAPTLTMPNTVTMPDSFTVEASKHYEVDVLNNYGAVMAWAN